PLEEDIVKETGAEDSDYFPYRHFLLNTVSLTGLLTAHRIGFSPIDRQSPSPQAAPGCPPAAGEFASGEGRQNVERSLPNRFSPLASVWPGNHRPLLWATRG